MSQEIYKELLRKNAALEAERDRALLALADLHERLREKEDELEGLRGLLQEALARRAG